MKLTVENNFIFTIFSEKRTCKKVVHELFDSFRILLKISKQFSNNNERK